MAPHYLRPQKHMRPPQRFISIGYVTQTIETSLIGRMCYGLELADYAVSLWVKSGDQYKEHPCVADDYRETLWQTLYELCSPNSVTHVWVNGLYTLLVCGGFFNELESGRFTTRRHVAYGTVQGAGVNRKRHDGYLVLRNPPTIANGWTATQRKRLLFGDVGDIGFKGASKHLQPGESATGSGGFVSNWWSLLESEKLGRAKQTLAGQAMSTFRTRCLNSPILIHENKQVASLEREAYFPGRCEVLRIGNVPGPIYHLDIKSCYPAITKNAMMPARFAGHGQPSFSELLTLMGQGFCLIANLTVSADDATVPYRLDKSIVYPVGSFCTTLCAPEIALLLTCGNVLKVNHAAWYEPSESLTAWTELMIRLRSKSIENGLKDMEGQIKRMTNSLYGSFAKRECQWVDCDIYPEDDKYAFFWGESIRGEPTVPFRVIAGQQQYESKAEDAKDTCVFLAAWVNSLARVKLWECIKHAGRRNTYYCDTDSLFTSQRGYDNLVASGVVMRNKPGTLRLVNQYRSMRILGQKQYTVDNGRKQSGVPAYATESNDGNVTWYSVESIFSSLRRRSAPSPCLAQRVRGPALRYDAGQVRPNGIVWPLVIGDWQT